MTAKRFIMDNESDIIEFDYNTNEYIQDFIWADGKSWDKICNRLNELIDENRQLQKQRNSYLNDLNKLEIAIEKVQNEFKDNQEVQRAIARIVVIKRELKSDV